MFEWQADVFRPPFSVVWIVAVLLASAVGSWLVNGRETMHPLRRWVLIGLRVVGLATLGWVLMGPTLLDAGPRSSGRVPLWILADTSASMSERDVMLPGESEPVSRWQALHSTWLSDEALSALGGAAQVRLHRFDEEMASVPPGAVAGLDAAGRETRLFEAVRQVVRSSNDGDGEVPPTVLLLSDGHDTRGGAADPMLIEMLHRQGGRIHVVPVGSQRRGADLAVQAWPDADLVFEGESTAIQATVVQRGLAGRSARVSLMRDGRTLEARQVDLGEQPTQRVAFEVTAEAEAGQPVTTHSYQVRVDLVGSDAAAGADDEQELFLENNERPVFLQVSRERIKVLLLEGQPYWDTRYLSQVLRDDPHVELTAVFDLGDGRRLRVADAGSEAFEGIDQSTLNGFDVVMLGKAVGSLLPDPAMLVDYVRQRGGALVLARGRAYEEAADQRVLSSIEPVVWGREAVERLRLEVTAEGQRSPLLRLEGEGPADAVVTRLPGMLAATRISQERSASVVLLRQRPEGEQMPAMAAVAHQRAGGGQVMAVLTDGLWRWAMLPSELDEHASVYHLFWSRAVRWLASGDDFLPGREVSLVLDRLSAEPGEAVGLTVRTRFVDEAYRPVVTLVDPAGETQTIHPERTDARGLSYRAAVRPEQTGVYRVVLNRPATSIEPEPAPVMAQLAVFDRSTERIDPSARPRVLERLADRTGGRRLGLDDLDVLLSELETLRRTRTADVTARYDFARPWALVVIFGCLGLEWLVRRRGGLL